MPTSNLESGISDQTVARRARLTMTLAICTLYLVAVKRFGVFHGRRSGRFRIRFIDRLARDGRFRLERRGRAWARPHSRQIRGAPPPTITAQFTIGKSIDLRMANLRKALFAPAGGAGTRISVMISPTSQDRVAREL